MTHHDHAHPAGQSCPLPEPFKVLRMPKELTDAFEDFLEQNVPGYNAVDFVSIQVETTEAEQEEPYVPERTQRFFLVDHDADGDGPTPINDPKEPE